MVVECSQVSIVMSCGAGQRQDGQHLSSLGYLLVALAKEAGQTCMIVKSTRVIAYSTHGKTYV
jgi:hypothetical protein